MTTSPLTGESKVSRKAIAQGMSECFGCLYARVRQMRNSWHTRPRVQRHPAFPAPSLRGGNEFAKLGQITPRERDTCHHVIAAKRSNPALPQRESWIASSLQLLAMTGWRATCPPSARRAKARSSIPEAAVIEPRSRGVLDAPPEPVIGLAEGETRWRGMTAVLVASSLKSHSRVGPFRSPSSAMVWNLNG